MQIEIEETVRDAECRVCAARRRGAGGAQLLRPRAVAWPVAKEQLLGTVVPALLAAMDDYSVDNRSFRISPCRIDTIGTCNALQPMRTTCAGVCVSCYRAWLDRAASHCCGRGDVGSWVREAAMQALGGALSALRALAPPEDAPACEHLAHQMTTVYLKQAVERIARVREVQYIMRSLHICVVGRKTTQHGFGLCTAVVTTPAFLRV